MLFINEEFDEVGWYYTSASGSEIDRYVSYNYANGAWAYGQLSRTAWLDAGVEPYPRATSSGIYMSMKLATITTGSPMTNVFIESSDLDIEDGDEFSFVSKLIPDVRFLSNPDGGQINFCTKNT